MTAVAISEEIDLAGASIERALAEATDDSFVLPAEFWQARPSLGQIRDAARARLIAPDALAGAVLARVAQYADYRIVLPAIIGRQGSLNLIVGVAGPSGAGKGSVADESRFLLGEPETAADFRVGEAPAGSGEGMVRAFFEVERDPDDKRRTVLTRSRESVLYRIDEGEILRHLGARQGQTTLQVLRQMFSGEALGGSYVDESRRSYLPPHTYRAGVLMGIQDVLAGFLLADAAGGTPQRILWLAAVDPGASRDLAGLPDHPGKITWAPPSFTDPQVQRLARPGPDGLRRVEMEVDPAISDELQRDRLRMLTGADVEALDSHRGLVQLKTAGLLAIFDGRLDVNAEDWTLAQALVDTSRAVRRWMARSIAADDSRRDFASNEKAAVRAARVERAKVAAVSRVDRIARVLAKRVARSPEPVSHRDLVQSVASRDRDEYEAARGQAIAAGWVRETDQGFEPGDRSWQ